MSPSNYYHYHIKLKFHENEYSYETFGMLNVEVDHRIKATTMFKNIWWLENGGIKMLITKSRQRAIAGLQPLSIVDFLDNSLRKLKSPEHEKNIYRLDYLVTSTTQNHNFRHGIYARNWNMFPILLSLY